eukprot:3059802-Karenia_brevis.AAC.1
MSRNGCTRKECMCREGRTKKKVTFCASFGGQKEEEREDDKEEEWQKSKNMIRMQKIEETNKTETRNMFEAIQEEEEEPPEMVESSDEEEEEEEEDKKECSALFWEEDQ